MKKKRENFNFVICEELLENETYLLKLSQEEPKSILLNDKIHESSTIIPSSLKLNKQSLTCVSGRVKNTDIFSNRAPSNWQINYTTLS